LVFIWHLDFDVWISPVLQLHVGGLPVARILGRNDFPITNGRLTDKNTALYYNYELLELNLVKTRRR